ncbi:three-helix bundle dimerization domain-containing protein [Streptomyces sp. NPDC101206]|uniref:three-helix bundle dimerization domain-containing protein n=1 Tax=Streptomyces sp. NPDC101206 TaxID=3366128 RepID=UPI003801A968
MPEAAADAVAHHTGPPPAAGTGAAGFGRTGPTAGCPHRRKIDFRAWAAPTRREGKQPETQPNAEQLITARPHLDIDVVRGSVKTAYAELRYARVRTYLPVLMERRARDLLPDGQSEIGT